MRQVSGALFLYIDIVYITDGLLFAVWLLCAYGGGDDDERRAKQRVSIYITKALLYMVSDVSKLCGLDLHWRRDESWFATGPQGGSWLFLTTIPDTIIWCKWFTKAFGIYSCNLVSENSFCYSLGTSCKQCATKRALIARIDDADGLKLRLCMRLAYRIFPLLPTYTHTSPSWHRHSISNTSKYSPLIYIQSHWNPGFVRWCQKHARHVALVGLPIIFQQHSTKQNTRRVRGSFLYFK